MEYLFVLKEKKGAISTLFVVFLVFYFKNWSGKISQP